MMDREKEKELITQAIKGLPEIFRMRAYPGQTFRISVSNSYVRDNGEIMIYTDILLNGEWKDFCKGTINELRKEIC